MLLFSGVLIVMGLSSCAKEEPPKPNTVPVISGVEVNPAVIAASATATITCSAVDQDGDTLNYLWTALNGKIDGNGQTVSFTAPEQGGVYEIEVEVNDGRGGIVKEKKSIQVNSNPEIKALTPDNTEIKVGDKTQIVCEAVDSDSDELKYEWSVTKGEILSDTIGTNAVFTAPAEADTCVVTVKITDGKGGETSKSFDLSIIAKKGKSSNKSKKK